MPMIYSKSMPMDETIRIDFWDDSTNWTAVISLEKNKRTITNMQINKDVIMSSIKIKMCTHAYAHTHIYHQPKSSMLRFYSRYQ